MPAGQRVKGEAACYNRVMARSVEMTKSDAARSPSVPPSVGWREEILYGAILPVADGLRRYSNDKKMSCRAPV